MNLTQMTTDIYYCGQESLRRNGVAIIVNKKESEMQYLGTVSKMTECTVTLNGFPWKQTEIKVVTHHKPLQGQE